MSQDEQNFFDKPVEYESRRLNLYEYSKKTRDEIINIMENLKDQLWLPYKTCEEFYTKRMSVIEKSNNFNPCIHV